jgi:NAD(P)-dependent dehydrogenase (short-subunit alcohol dehydrogenase family)
MATETLADRRVLVVGASAGIGRALAVAAVRAGAEVVMAARRGDRLAAAVAEAGGGTAVVADLSDAEDCRRLAADAAAILGAIDLVVFAAGVARLRPIEETTAVEWWATMNTNLIGINLVTAAALPSLAPGAIVAALSSEAVGHPHHWLAAYGASKAALEESLRSWRLEHPEVRFSCVAVGATIPTEFAVGFDGEMLGAALRTWAKQGLMRHELMATDDVAGMLVGLFSTALLYPGIGMEHVMLRSPSPAIDSAHFQAAMAVAAT